MHRPSVITYAMLFGREPPCPVTATARLVTHEPPLKVRPVPHMSRGAITREAVLQALRERPGTAMDIANLFDTPRRTITTHISRLKRDGLVTTMSAIHKRGRKVPLWMAV